MWWSAPATEDSDAVTTVTLHRATGGFPSTCTPREINAGMLVVRVFVVLAR